MSGKPVVARNVRLAVCLFNPLTPELNPSAQRCLARLLIWDFAS
jgi:hypothetical protein